jgi:hypothetical protein
MTILAVATSTVALSASPGTTTVLGALERHFRDSAWGVQVPRSTQHRTATEIGISQPHVSRLLKQSLPDLRIACRAAATGPGTPRRCL